MRLLNISLPWHAKARGTNEVSSRREWSKKFVQQGRSPFGARSVLPVREHGKRARTPLAAFFNIPPMSSQLGSVGLYGSTPTPCITKMAGALMTTLDLLKTKREDILRLAALRGVRNLRVFGSVARGEEDRASDVDFIVDREPGKSLLDLGGLLMDLQELFGCFVDIVTEQGLKARLRDRVLQEAFPL
jgi:predicted nucleotidyltransferase